MDQAERKFKFKYVCLLAAMLVALLFLVFNGWSFVMSAVLSVPFGLVGVAVGAIIDQRG
jgi:uncharacterized membrane protein